MYFVRNRFLPWLQAKEGSTVRKCWTVSERNQESKTKRLWIIIIIIIAATQCHLSGVEKQNQERLLAASCSTRELRATGRRKRGGNVETGS